MQDKSTNIPLHVQQLPAGVAPNDHNIEFVGCRDNKTVIWLQRGHSNSFNNLPQNIYSALEELFLTDQSAFKVIINLFPKESHNIRRLVEIYTYYMYGDLDKTPDVIDGCLQDSENYRHSKYCL